MKLHINGEVRDLDDVSTIADVVNTLGFPAAALLVEHNGTALRREEWTLAVSEGDRLEVIRIVAGGGGRGGRGCGRLFKLNLYL